MNVLPFVISVLVYYSLFPHLLSGREFESRRTYLPTNNVSVLDADK